MEALIFFVIFALIFYFVVIVPIQAAGRALGAAGRAMSEAQDRNLRAAAEAQDRRLNQQRLRLIEPQRGRVKINLKPNRFPEVQGYDRNSQLVFASVSDDALLGRLFPRQLDHAKWRLEFVSRLKPEDQSKWESILDLSWEAIRILEERDRVVGTVLSIEQTRSIMEFADQALVSLCYKSTHANSQALCEEILQELNQAEEDYEQAEDDLQRRSISTAIKTHRMRLKKQKAVERRLYLANSELKSLEATLKLVIEGICAEISSHHLDAVPGLSPYDSALLELDLPILDEIWQSYS